MNKKTRDLKKHYREVERDLRNYDVDLSEGCWYDMWHIHLDWDGVTSVSENHRRIHILYYLKIFEKIHKQTEGNRRDFQTWIYLDADDGYYDAIYFQTENPEGNFPYCLSNFEWTTEVPHILKGLLDLSKFNVGILRDEKGNVYSYMIQKKGLGLKIDRK